METFQERTLRLSAEWAKRNRGDEQLAATSRSNRDYTIKTAHAEGVSVADLANATGLTRTMLYKIINKKEVE